MSYKVGDGEEYFAHGLSMNRHLKAFLLAPLVVPGLFTPYLLLLLFKAPWLLGLPLMKATVVSYAGALFLGAPAYLGLRSLGWTAFWIAPVVGFVIGVITGIFAVPELVFYATPSGGWSMGVHGALVGVALWLIGRPDRP
jgi:hypothetical protein